MIASCQESYDNPRQCFKKQRHHFASESAYSQGYSLLVVMYGCESWTIKKTDCWRIDAFKPWCWRRLLRVPWTARRSNQSILKEINPPWIFIRRTDAEAEDPNLWLLGTKSWLTGEVSLISLILGKIKQKEKRVTENEMVGWHHWFNGHELGQTMGDGEGQGSLACCSPWSHEESDMTWWLNNNKPYSSTKETKDPKV